MVLRWPCRAPALAAREPTVNDAFHMAAITQIRIAGQMDASLERKVAEGKTKKEALRSLAPQISNAVYRQLASTPDERPGRTLGNDS